MLTTFRHWIARPLAEDFGFKNQFQLAVLSGFYVFVFTLFLTGSAFSGWQRISTVASLALGCIGALVVANWAIPRFFSAVYDEERWTVGRHIVHVFWVLFCISAANKLVLFLWGFSGPSFLEMYLLVTLIGFFPIMLGVFVVEQRRLKRNLATARTVNQQLDRLHEPQPKPVEVAIPKSVSLASENGKDQLNLLPNQLLYIESVGNYVEVHWLNFMFPQKTILRSTLKDVEATLSEQLQFFRCHRAFLVNLKAVNQTEGNARGYQLTISGSNREIPVSRGYIDAFNARMKQLV